jgi:excisionase family DNA binding protein
LQLPSTDTDSTMLSTAEAAKALGVGVSSVKRWVDDGILPAYRTAGGHRKLCLSDLLRAARNSELPRVDPRQLPVVLPSATPSESPKEASQRLFECLQTGDNAEAEAIIRREYFSGLSMSELADAVIRPAMQSIGDAWYAQKIGIFHEHRATHICLQAIMGLKRFLDDREISPEAPIAVGGSPEGHWHSLANFLAELVLIESGWRVVNLGANTPIDSFLDAIDELHPRMVWLSINPSEDAHQLASECAALVAAANRAGAEVAVGGRGVTKEMRDLLPTARFGESLAQLAASAREIFPLPKPRRRGRPSSRSSS